MALDSSWDVANTNAWTFAESHRASVHLLSPLLLIVRIRKKKSSPKTSRSDLPFTALAGLCLFGSFFLFDSNVLWTF